MVIAMFDAGDRDCEVSRDHIHNSVLFFFFLYSQTKIVIVIERTHIFLHNFLLSKNNIKFCVLRERERDARNSEL